MNEYTFKSTNGINSIHCCEWVPEGKPVAILQLVHGMAEHITRYGAFAEYLAKNGILVAGHDHIGHGESCDPKDWGYFGPKDGWLTMINDVEEHRKLIDEKYPGIPHFILGHSMGSFVVRSYLAKYGRDINGAIVMGTANKNGAVGAGKTLVSMIRKFKGDRHLSKLVTNMAFGSYLKRIPDAKSAYDWLSRDPEIVKKYDEDPGCGFTFTAAGYADLFGFLGYMDSEECYKDTNVNIPILVVAGEEDPVGAYGVGPKEYYEKLKSLGCEKASLKLYPGMRHEILNEIGKEEVYEDMKNFVLGNLPKAE